VWWLTPVIPALGKLRQEDYKFEASLGYISRLFQKTKKPGSRMWQYMPVVPATWELEAGRSLEARSSRPAWARPSLS
jgi:hypothetical protein